MRNLDYYRATLLGVVLGMSLLVLFHMFFNVALDTKEPETPKSNFTVIEKYKNCEVVQWSYGALAEYKYFLHCPK